MLETLVVFSTLPFALLIATAILILEKQPEVHSEIWMLADWLKKISALSYLLLPLYLATDIVFKIWKTINYDVYSVRDIAFKMLIGVTPLQVC